MAFLNAIGATSRSPCIQGLDGHPRSKAKWMNVDVVKALPTLDITDIQTFITNNKREIFMKMENLHIYYPNWYMQLAMKISRFEEIDQRDMVFIMRYLYSCGNTWAEIVRLCLFLGF